MKKFKDFMTENFDGADTTQGHVPFDIDDSVVKNKVNAILGHCATAEFMNPVAAINQMEAKLMQLGMSKMHKVGDMGVVESEEFDESGSFSLEFSRYGETFGKDVDTPIDEFQSETKTYTLDIRYERLVNNSYKVYGSLV
jgi:hypothetical protein|tara:strand:- start:472 stop:891 length:420 start_codon:yes stop_codon:yes gene_type:complete